MNVNAAASIFVTSICALMLFGCASSLTRLQPMPTPNIELKAPNPETTSSATPTRMLAYSKKTESWVCLETNPNTKIADYGIPLTVSVFNGGTEVVDFGIHQITASEGSAPLVLMDGNDINRAERKKQRIMAMFAAMSKMNAAAAPRNAIVQQQTSANMRMADASIQSSSATASALTQEYSKIALKEEIVEPLKTHGGFFVVTNYGWSSPLRIKVKVGSEEHEVMFSNDGK